MILRKATISDALLLYDWTNDPLVREMSSNSRRVDWADHISWLDRKLRDSNCHLFILMKGFTPMGVIRFDLDHGEQLISYSIDSRYRGKGYGKAIIDLGLKEMGHPQVVAMVKPENIASVKIFTALGFKPDLIRFVLEKKK